MIHKFPPEVFDIDADTESDNENQTAKVDLGTKEGYLLKGPEIGSERIFSNLASKSFKKRYCSMVREADGTYILEVYKDDKKTDTKLTIVMDFCSDVVKVSLILFNYFIGSFLVSYFGRWFELWWPFKKPICSEIINSEMVTRYNRIKTGREVLVKNSIN